jgi:hypothetical protein
MVTSPNVLFDQRVVVNALANGFGKPSWPSEDLPKPLLFTES